MVYADWECSLVKTGEEGRTHRHEANSCGFYFLCTFDSERNKYFEFKGATCTVDMVLELKNLAKRCIKEMKENTEMYLTTEEETQHREASTCFLCNGDFEKANPKVRDHDHRTGNYRGACHQRCNINYYSNRYLPVFVHNLRGYDAHLILKQAYEIVGKKERINAIPQSSEKSMTFSIGDLKFKDSCQFLAEKLENLVKGLKTEGKIYTNISTT